DVRPQVTQSADGKVADARPDEAVRIAAGRPVLKPWILPTANRFIADPARRHARPAAPPRLGDVPYLRADFDDSAGQPVTLPHDWAIAGPFIAEVPTAAWAGCRAGASAGTGARSTSRPRSRDAASISTWTAPCPMPPSGSMASWSAAGRMATTAGAWTSRRMSPSVAATSSRSGSTIRPNPPAGIPAAGSTATSG